jgi:general secretion pathway protein I
MKTGDGPKTTQRREPGSVPSGFTLIEILIAVAILAVALAATTRAASLATDGTLETRQRVLATWSAQNRIAELRARRIFPSVSSNRLETQQGGLALVIDETVSETPNPTMRRVDLAVSDARSPDRVLSRLTAYVTQ